MDIDQIKEICPDLDFSNDASAQFLRFIPVLSVMMADGQRQEEEMRLFYKYVDQFISEWLYSKATPMDARRFFAPFMEIPLKKNRKRQLVELTDYLVSYFAEEWMEDRRLSLYNICMEMAAASPCLNIVRGINTRISGDESRFLVELLHALRLG